MREWVAGEDKFALQQAKKGALIRVKEGRAKAIDWLVMNLRVIEREKNIYEDDSKALQEIEIPVPYSIFEKLSLTELEKLQTDIKTYNELEGRGFGYEFWDAMSILCQDAMYKLRFGVSGLNSRAVHTVSDDIEEILKDKNYEDLVLLETRVEHLLAGDSAVDVDFWSDLKKELLFRKARAKAQRIYDLVIRDRVRMLRESQAAEARSALKQITTMKGPIEYETVMDKVPQTGNETVTLKSSDAVDQDEFMKQLVDEQKRVAQLGFIPLQKTAQATSQLQRPSGKVAASEALFEREIERGTEDDEAVLNEEDEQLSGSTKLIKPRYFNRVQMGYDWNKYNQTHYNLDNPPPKVVQGYKFSIFYPELIDSTRAPTYKIIRDGKRSGGDSDTCLIKFIAGPPYQDISFRIVDRDWDYSSRYESRFLSNFDKGILQLQFKFKKIYYRK
ncbi:cactus-binding C-terminus of cactin protein-domain-containing protein [Lipomyces arxii]|uniref:cactus-binding C-terminus of cactin protein-domain-containing protein n=1 Tax=Lipomyces arxii TaxID=56418 RepID=UPI0034CD1D68